MTAEDLARRHAQAFDGTSRPWSAEDITTLLASAHVHLIDTGHAFALLRVVANEAEILTLATDPAHRRQGLARALLETLISRARTEAADTLFLEVSDTNHPARALYAAAGFREVARRSNYYRAPQGHRTDALILSKSL
ncbi:MAG: GNAT family N-acetyltransferase [Pseudomonadota bacterium]